MIAHNLRKLLGEQRGTATMELALATPMFAILLMGVVDITTGFHRKLELEQAVQRSIERVMQTTAEETVEANIKQEAAAAAGISQNNVTVTYTLTCAGVSKPYTEDCTSTEEEVRYINVVATDTFTPMFPLSKIGMSGTSFALRAETGIRTQ